MVVPHAGDSDKVEIPFYNWGKTSLICSAKKGSLTVPGRVSSFSSVLVRRISCIYYYFFISPIFFFSLSVRIALSTAVSGPVSQHDYGKRTLNKEKRLSFLHCRNLQKRPLCSARAGPVLHSAVLARRWATEPLTPPPLDTCWHCPPSLSPLRRLTTRSRPGKVKLEHVVAAPQALRKVQHSQTNKKPRR